MNSRQLALPRIPYTPPLRWQGGLGWRGWALPPARQFAFAKIAWAELRNKELEMDGIRCVKVSRSRHVLRIERPERYGLDLPGPVFVKRYLINTMRRRVGNLLSGGKAGREFRLGWRLLRRGVLTPEPLAFAIAGPGRILEPAAPRGFSPSASFLLTMELTHGGTLHDCALQGLFQRDAELARRLARFLAAMHAAGFYHDDCSAHNLALNPCVDSAAESAVSAELRPFIVFDIDHGRLYRRAVSRRLRAVNLFQIMRSLRKTGMPDPAPRWEFLGQYLEAAESFTPEEIRIFAREIDRLAHRKLKRPLLEV